MGKPVQLFVVRAAADAEFARRALVEPLAAVDGVRCQEFDPLRPPARPAGAWYVVVVSPAAALDRRAVEWVMDRHPDRVLPVLARDCDPALVHPRLDFLTPFDLRDPADGVGLLLKQWKRDGVIGRAKADASILMFLSLKGGVAKTTNAVAVAECLAELGNRVLVIDTDHQCGASALLLGEDRTDELERKGKTVSDLFSAMLSTEFDPATIDNFAVPAESVRSLAGRLRVIPASLRLEDFWENKKFSLKKESRTRREWYEFLRETQTGVVRAWLRRHYDYVIIDCPPAIAWQVRFFLLVADGVIVPTIPDRLSVRGARYLMRRIANIKVRIDPVGLIWSMKREIEVHKDYVGRVRTGAERLAFEPDDAHPLPRPFATVLPNAVAVIRAAVGTSPPASVDAKYEPEFAAKFRALCREIVGRVTAPRPAAAPVRV